MIQVTMYKIAHTHVTTEAMTTAHLASGVSNALLCAVYVVKLLDCRSVKHTINGATEQVRKKVALNSCIISLMYEVIKLAMCGSHGFSSDVRIRNFALFLMV